MMRLKNDSSETKAFVMDWLAHLELTRNRIKKWDKDGSEVAAKAKTKTIKSLITEKDRVWSILYEAKNSHGPFWKAPGLLVRNKEELEKELWADAVKALFDACARAHKREGGQL
jgi:hypothetical protein